MPDERAAVATLGGIAAHLDQVLEVRAVRDYGPNGLQVEARDLGSAVTRVATAVSANLAAIEAAVAFRAELLVVHHGLIWGGGIERVTGPTARRLAALLGGGVSLLAYHLPLDRHPTLGNNAGLCDLLGLGARTPFGEVRGVAIGTVGELAAPLPAAELRARVAAGVGHPTFAFMHGPAQVRRIAVCSGAAGDMIEAARAAGADAFLTGELAERAGELARELGIHLLAAGHYATEVFGPQRLGAELATRFGVATTFVDVPSPL